MPATLSLSDVCGAVPETVRGRPYVIHCDPTKTKLVYGVSNNVIIVDMKDNKKMAVVNHHSLKVTAVAYSPSGYYIASGDSAGNVKIWDTVGEEHLVKYEYRLLSGEVRDISWSEDSKRLVVAGDGRESFACAIMWDTGATVGSVSGHVKCGLACDFRKKRPYSVLTASEDFYIGFFKNIPLKFEKFIKTHSNFVNCVRYSNNCDLAASCSSDGKIFIYDALTMEVKFECKDVDGKSHKGGVYSVSFSPCDTFLVSASGDKTAKIWKTEDGSCVKTICFGDAITDQQLGCLWMKDNIVTVSLSGKINIVDKDAESPVVDHIWGHNKALVAFAMPEDRSCYFTSSFDGILNHWDMKNSTSTKIAGNGLKNQVSCMSIFGDKVAICGVEDTVRFFSVSSKCYDETISIKLPSQPQSIFMKDENTIAVGCDKHIIVIVNNKIVVELESSFQVTCVCFAPDASNTLLVCGNKGSVDLYKFDGSSLVKNEKESFPIHDIGTWIAYSPDKSMLAVANTNKWVFAYNASDFEKITSWQIHGNRVNCVAWSPDGTTIASCGVDGNMYLMKPKDSGFLLQQRNVHRGQFVRAVAWIDDKTVMTMGQQDCLIKFWKMN